MKIPTKKRTKNSFERKKERRERREMPSKKKTAKKTKADDDVKVVVVDDDALEENENAKGCGGTPAPQKLPQITVARLLNETQLGVSMHKRITQQMTRLRTENPEKFLRDTCQCLLHVLLVYKVRPSSSFTTQGGGSFLLSSGFSSRPRCFQ